MQHDRRHADFFAQASSNDNAGLASRQHASTANANANATPSHGSHPATARRTVLLGLGFSFVRLPLMALAAIATLGIFAAAGMPLAFPPSPVIATLYLIPVNVVSLLLLRAVLHREGRSIRGLVGFRRDRLVRDILWGLLWLAVLYLPFALTVMGSMLLLYGADAFPRVEDVFVPAPGSLPSFDLATGIVLGALAVLLFAPLNAPAEELVYRGYAPTVPAMLVYGLAFFVWGIGSGLIYLRQRRLMPLIVSHFVVNLLTSAPALAVPFLTA